MVNVRPGQVDSQFIVREFWKSHAGGRSFLFHNIKQSFIAASIKQKLAIATYKMLAYLIENLSPQLAIKNLIVHFLRLCRNFWSLLTSDGFGWF